MPRLTDDEIRAQIPAARARADAARVAGKRAEEAVYDVAKRELRLTFPNGVSVSIPVAMIQALETASTKALRDVELSPSGSSLHFETLDVDLSIPALLALAFKGTAATQALGAIAGSTLSERKSAAARANGKRGGRPPKKEVKPGNAHEASQKAREREARSNGHAGERKRRAS